MTSRGRAKMIGDRLESDGVLCRKFRWTFEGRNKSGELVIPLWCARIRERPSFPYFAIGDEEGGHIEHVVNEPSVGRLWLGGDNSFSFFEVPDNFDRYEEVSLVELKLWDGAGACIETWILRAVQLLPNPHLDGDCDYVELLAIYEKSDYIDHTKFFAGVV